MSSSTRGMDIGDPRTPMAWQHRDINYHQSGYQDRYGPGAEMGSSRAGPPSTSDRLSHRTDKSWQRDPRDQPHLVPYSNGYQQEGNNRPYQAGPSSHQQYPPSRPSYSTGRPASRPQSPSATSSTTSSSSSEETSEDTGMRGPMGPPPHPYGYPQYYPGPYGSLKPARSMPALAQPTWDGDPCPVHGHGPLSMPGYPPMLPPPGPPVMPPPGHHPGGHMTLPPPNHSGASRRSTSIYDMRMMMPPPPPMPIYGTLPIRPPPSVSGDKRSVAGSVLSPSLVRGSAGIPPQLLPPMARPRPLVMSEDGTTEPLPVRAPIDKVSLPPDVAAKVAAEDGSVELKKGICCRGGACVGWVILSLICVGILLTIMLKFILQT